MGRRKSKRKPPPKLKTIQPLDQQFDCPFCNHIKACEVRMDKRNDKAYISCRVCGEDFEAKTNFLSEPIDVYNDWIDACEESNKPSKVQRILETPNKGGSKKAVQVQDLTDDSDEDVELQDSKKKRNAKDKNNHNLSASSKDGEIHDSTSNAVEEVQVSKKKKDDKTVVLTDSSDSSDDYEDDDDDDDDDDD